MDHAAAYWRLESRYPHLAGNQEHASISDPASKVVSFRHHDRVVRSFIVL